MTDHGFSEDRTARAGASMAGARRRNRGARRRPRGIGPQARAGPDGCSGHPPARSAEMLVVLETTPSASAPRRPSPGSAASARFRRPAARRPAIRLNRGRNRRANAALTDSELRCDLLELLWLAEDRACPPNAVPDPCRGEGGAHRIYRDLLQSPLAAFEHPLPHTA